MNLTLRWTALSTALMAFSSSHAWADSPPYNVPDRFVPAAEAGLQDTVPGGLLMIIAYIVAWVILFGYVAFLIRAQRTAGEALREARLRHEELEERVAELERGSA